MTPESKQTISKELREAWEKEFSSAVITRRDGSSRSSRSPEALLQFIAARETKAREDAVREVIQEVVASVPVRQDPTHGSCCTCQSCGHFNEECVCERREWQWDLVNCLRSKFLTTSLTPDE